MSQYLSSVCLAFWLGILTSISPCPLTANIAAVSFLSKNGQPSESIISGLCYSIGRILAYFSLSMLITSGILSIWNTSFFLQRYGYITLGPLLIVLGIVILGLLKAPNITLIKNTEKLTRHFKNYGIIGAIPLGFCFAMAFCPISAALFFGSLIPLSVKAQSPMLLSIVYGLGTALPIIAFTFSLMFGIKSVAKLFNKVNILEKRLRTVTGMVILSIGVYLLLTNILLII